MCLGGLTSFPESLMGPLDVMPHPPARTRHPGLAQVGVTARLAPACALQAQELWNKRTGRHPPLGRVRGTWGVGWQGA